MDTLTFVSSIFFNLKFYLFIYGCAGSSVFQGFPLVVASQSYSLILVRGLLVAMASLIVHRGLWNTGSVVVECGLVALQHVGSSLTRD